MYQISNKLIKIAVKKIGAELYEISSVKNKTAFMWDADPTIWGSFAPNLFPIIGALKNNEYIFEGKTYNMPKHGFIRHNPDIKLIEKTESSLKFQLKYNQESLKLYPFKFCYNIQFSLKENILHIHHEVKNLDNKPMFFSIGGHPAFKCPVYENEKYSDYNLRFEFTETAETYLLNLENGLLTNQKELVLDKSNTLDLNYSLFNKDALVFKDLKSRKITLNSKNKGDIITLNYADFPHLGIWAKPNADYVCIEPWIGYADLETTNQQLPSKEGIIKLEASSNFKAKYSIEIHKAHVV
ncbi:galactose mutarotase-like enzyme [Oceanihabitans sediminis]|uniref:Aldose 1-epimerase family protein n=1 Tax=Oceanihabitans sediminis TaxID=1812012 RepID=A0A368P5B9_9FLAO|nr:aldose 1-epimerase family protein [Oceanihabitans sediminis]RBP32825.1 galactose mutarotase-like enzyme [Oceanihabitans sediminis]RCU57643.1 aldose 1-epimerase family protein [Oceanihabitans sediminis]